MADHTEIKLAVYELIREFVERQRVVHRVISELRPDMFVLADPAISWDEKFLAIEKYKDVPQRGYWGEKNKWLYFFHGNGCRLRHQITEEIIDWDAGQINLFNPYKLAYWVEWRLSTPPQTESVLLISDAMDDDISLDGVRAFMLPIIDHLHRDGLLSEQLKQGNRFLLDKKG